MMPLTYCADIVFNTRCQLRMKLPQRLAYRLIEVKCVFQNLVWKKESITSLINVLYQFLVTGNRLSEAGFGYNKGDVVARNIQNAIERAIHPGIILIVCGPEVSCAITR
ncbi:hypothetical protein DAA51_38575 [Bradyrhizobium sp. WBAH10]|nr:hypothetical protein [Bradyrhizobium sp. WBAH30]MDD1547548.1 hypothetical protein [Bradyrhizobium sp. WBAH41]MDD1561187.1 hypothetical protein [Bradyrhizobium sp. WBAH23]MDD1568663.1 hypothetical protein [Bradyrhizobium sp. WBAH33]MDD1594641.1 hypothetical protein [Bradyrhizobium sp. WBAH42]NRB92124.1 hypothetical protein [Bradyrhizobium sp. WBAH10]QCJ93600.1 hypothetical protein DAA57_38315 [Bradyrhizobium yuanmingense]